MQEKETLYDKICNYQVLSEEEIINEEQPTKSYRKAVIRDFNGSVVEMRMPLYEDKAKRGAEITRAIFEFAFPGEDFSNAKSLHVIV